MPIKNKGRVDTEEMDQETGEPIDALPEGIENGLVDEQVGFPPYWTPAEGKKLYAKPVAIDTRDPQFYRYVLEAGHVTACNTGPHEDDEKVTVMKGEYFTMSVYAALPLDRFFGEFVLIEVTGSREVKKGDLWLWRCRVSQDAKKRIAARRTELAKKLGPAAAIPGLTEAAKTLPVS